MSDFTVRLAGGIAVPVNFPGSAAAQRSSDAADRSEAWAEGVEPGGPGTKSAKGYALDAAADADDADGSRRRAQIARGFATRTALLAATGMQDGDPSLVTDQSGEHNALPGEVARGGAAATVGTPIPDEGEYTRIAGVWLRTGDTQRQRTNAEGTAQVGAVNLAAAGQVSAATTERIGAEAAAVAARQAAAARFLHFGSAMMPFENGRSTDLRKNGQYTLTGSRTRISGTGTAGDFWRGPYSFSVPIAPHRRRVDEQNFWPHVFGTAGTFANTSTRAMGFRYITRQNSNISDPNARGYYNFWVRGETGPGILSVNTAILPRNAPGPFHAFGFTDGTNTTVHFLDITTGLWYDGTPVANPGSWNGVSSFPFTNDIVIGSAGGTFPNANAASPQNATQWRGSIGDLLFCNVALTKADIEAMVAGSSPAAVALAAGATRHLHVPLASGGQLVSTINTSFTGITLTQQGVILPGQTMRQQDATAWILLDPFNTPEHFPVEFDSDIARVRLKGRVGSGLSGTLLWRTVLEDGRVWTDWQDSRLTITAGAFDGHVSVPEFYRKAQIQVCMSSNMAVIAATHIDCQSGPIIESHAQSEGVRTLYDGRTATGAATTLGSTLPENADTVVFATTTGFLSAQDVPGLLGDGACAAIHYIRTRTQRSILIRSDMIDGTSPLAQINDDDPSRSWSTLEDIRNLTSAKGPRGEAVVTGHIIWGWEAAITPTNVVTAAYIPLLQGLASGAVTVAGTSIAQADIDHFYYDGSSSFSAKIVIAPSNRAVAGSTTSVTDSATAGDRRDLMRNYSHILGYEIAPETTAHQMEGETASGLPAGSVTHPRPNNFEGSPEMAIAMAEAFLQSIGMGAYPGVVFFESIRAGSAANKVIVKVGDPRPHPGLGLPAGSTGYSLAQQTIVARSQIRLHVKKAGGDAGSGWEGRIRPAGGSFGAPSKAIVTSGAIFSPREVELTLSQNLNPGDTIDLWYLRGSPGRYDQALITQDAWRAGLIYFTGQQYASGEPNSIDDLVRLGWQVAGSNQALSFTA